MKVDVLGVKIDDVDMAEALSVVEKWIWNQDKSFGRAQDKSFGRAQDKSFGRAQDKSFGRAQDKSFGRAQDKSFGRAQDKHYIVTPNPEIIMAAQKDKLLKKILNSADLSIPDGYGLRLSGKVKNVVAGTDLMEALCKLAAEKGFTVGFLGGGVGIAEEAADHFKKKYPGLKVVLAESGGKIDKDGSVYSENSDNRISSDSQNVRNSDSRILRHSGILSHSEFSENGYLRIPSSDILFVAFGHIKQEKWIANNLDKIGIRVAMGVGGAFDYFSGKVPRAPKWMRDLGFEWLYRLIIQPTRIKRQLALLKYLWLIVLQ